MAQETIATKSKKKNWLYIISPCVIAAAFSLFAIISSYLEVDGSGGWSFIGVIIFVPILLLILGIDFLVKLIVMKKVLYVWIIETILGIIIFLVYKNRFLS